MSTTTKTAKAKPRRDRKPSEKLNSARAPFGGVGVFTSSAEDAEQLKTVAELDAWLASKDPAERGGLDIRGRTIAQLGTFKDDRGQFDQESLEKIVELGNAKKDGLKSNYKHRSMSDDNLGKYLGRDFDLQLAMTKDGIPCVKSAHFELDAMAMRPGPEGGGTPYGEYVAGLSISDPSSFSSSLTLRKTSERKLGEDGRPEKDAQGNRVPDIWRPTHLLSIDVVSIGAAVDDFLSAESSEEEMLETATQMFQRFFNVENMTPEAAKARLDGFAEKVILSSFETKEPMSTEEQIAELSAAQGKTNAKIDGLTSSIDKLVTVLTPKKEELPEVPATSELSREEFVTKATALCAAQGKPELLGGFLADKTLKIDDVKDALLKANSKELSMDSHNDDQGTFV